MFGGFFTYQTRKIMSAHQVGLSPQVEEKMKKSNLKPPSIQFSGMPFLTDVVSNAHPCVLSDLCHRPPFLPILSGNKNSSKDFGTLGKIRESPPLRPLRILLTTIKLGGPGGILLTSMKFVPKGLNTPCWSTAYLQHLFPGREQRTKPTIPSIAGPQKLQQRYPPWN